MEFLKHHIAKAGRTAAAIAVITMLFVCGRAPQAVGAPVQLEQKKIEAGLLYNLLKYTDWSEGSAASKKSDVIRVCLLGGDPFSGALSPLAGRTAQQRVIEIADISNLDDPEQCSLVFFHQSLAGKLDTYLPVLRNRNILTVSNIKGFAKGGGMVEFSMGEDDHIHIYLNVRAISGAGLSVSEQLVRLSRRVDQP